MPSVTDWLGARLLTTRWLVRAPIWLYRHGLGRVCGQRILMLEHVGRRSGSARYVCLEVVDRPAPGSITIVSGFGRTAQWYRNLRATPDCRVSIGRRRNVPARARLMSDDESAAALSRYQRVHPKAWRRLRGAIEKAVGHSIDGLPMVALTLQAPTGSA